MNTITLARLRAAEIKNEVEKNANTGERVGNALNAVLDAVEAIMGFDIEDELPDIVASKVAEQYRNLDVAYINYNMVALDALIASATTAIANANTIATAIAAAEAARLEAGSEVKTNKSVDIEGNKTSIVLYPNIKGLVDYISALKVLSYSAQTLTANEKIVARNNISAENTTNKKDVVDPASSVEYPSSKGVADYIAANTVYLSENEYQVLLENNLVLPTVEYNIYEA